MNDLARHLEQQYVEMGPSLRAYFRRQRGLDVLDDDLVQETFLRAWRERTRLRHALTPRAYLFGIARHVAIDALRRARPQDILPADLPAEPVAETDERLPLLRAAIAALPATHREPLLLKLQQELSYAEIAAVLDLPLGTVRSRLHYAIERLHLVLNPTSAPGPSVLPADSHET